MPDPNDTGIDETKFSAMLKDAFKQGYREARAEMQAEAEEARKKAEAEASKKEREKNSRKRPLSFLR